MIYTNKTIASRIHDILEDDATNLITLDISIKLSNGTVLVIPPEHIVLLDIHQDFYNAYMDYTNLKIELELGEFLELMANKQDIHVTVSFFKYGPDTIIKPVAFRIVEYIGVLKDMMDLSAKTSKSELEERSKNTGKEIATMPVELQLIPEAAYKLRKKKFNFILHKATTFDAIAMTTYALGLNEAYIETPDNTKEYTQVIIPPLFDISSVFDYLQKSEAYGVYDYGINYYYMLDTLYICGMFKRHTGNRIDIYTAGEDTYAGGSIYHKESKDKLEVVLSGYINNTKKSHDIQENVGTSLIQHSVANSIHELGEVSSNDKFTINKEFLNNLSLFDDDAGAIRDSWNQTYVIGDNQHKLTTALFMSRMEYLSAKWEFAMPFTFSPVSNISYLYDAGKKITTRSAWCKQVVYRIAKMQSISQKSFSCTASLEVGLLPEE